jgi:hypothetical protein
MAPGRAVVLRRSNRLSFEYLPHWECDRHFPCQPCTPPVKYSLFATCINELDFLAWYPASRVPTLLLWLLDEINICACGRIQLLLAWQSVRQHFRAEQIDGIQ